MIRKLMVICCLLFLFLFVSNLNVATADTASFRVYDNDTSYHRRIMEPDNGDNSSHAGIYQENEIATLYKWDTASLSGQCVSSASATFAVSLFQGINFGDTNYRWSVRRLLRDFTTAATWNTYDGTHNWTAPGGRGEGDVSSTYANNDMIYNFNNGYITFNLDPSEITKMIEEDKGLIFSLPTYTSGTHYITFGIPVLNITYTTCSSPTPSPTPAPTETPTPTPTPKLPVIFIPGIFGSEFEVKEPIVNSGIKQCINPLADYEYNQGDKVWFDQQRIRFDYKPCGRYMDVLALKIEDGIVKEASPEVKLKGTVVNDEFPGIQIGYHDLLDFFQNEKHYIPGKNFFIFPYDWRKDLSENITSLNAIIDTATASSGTSQVQIVTHSMGGLIARDYIRDPERAQKVKTLVELGAPHVGTPVALAHLLYSKCVKGIDLPVVDINFAECVINGDELKKLVQNYPGAFELLPSKKYYDDLYPDLYPFSDDRDIDNDPDTKGSLNYDMTKKLLSNLVDKKKLLLNIAETYHNELDTSFNIPDAFDTDTNGVETYLIAGSGQPTIGQIHDYYGYINIWGEREMSAYPDGLHVLPKVDADAINGDDTVPLLSATLKKELNVFYVNKTHRDLPTGTTLDLVYSLLSGNWSEGLPSDVQLLPFQFYGKIISVHSPVALHAYDSAGNHTGAREDGMIEVGIPDSSYDELGESKFIYLPNGGDYTIKTRATDEGSFDLKIKTYSESNLVKEQLYLSVPQTESTTATLTLNSENPVLQVDTENDGIVDYNLNPSSTLSGEALSDAKPPETAVQVGGNEGTNGWYKSNVTLSFNVEDTGAGLLKTYYYKDGEQILHEAEPNTIIDSEGTTSLWYFSVDKAGNTEKPKNITIKIDKTIPDVAISTPQDNGVYLLNSPLTANWQATDNLSGLDSQNGTVASGEAVDTSQAGAHTFEVTAVDNAGNSKTQTITYKVIYRFDGFLQPVNDTGHEQTCGTPCTLSIFKSGSTVPVKFQLKDALGNLVQAASLPQWINPQQGNALAESVNESEFVDPTDSSNTYSWDVDKYHYNWKTRDIPSGYHWLIGVRLDNGQTYTVNIGLR